jgi:hypothetical protein
MTKCKAMRIKNIGKINALQQKAIQFSDRIGYNEATVALANKLVRICWSVWQHERRFDGNFIPTSKIQKAG